MSSRPTIADIARECGVAQSTVSRALRDHPSISEERKRAIRAVAEALGFESRISARTLRGEGSQLVACIVPSLSHPFFSRFLEKMEAEAAHRNFQLLVANSGASPAVEKTIVKGLIAREVDGVFFVPSTFDSTALHHCATALNTVVVTLRHPDWPSVATSHEEGGRRVAEHFLETGRRSCLLIGAKEDPKFEGFLSYLASRRVTDFQITWLTLDGWTDDLSLGVRRALGERFTRATIQAIDCVFGYNDVAAVGALHGLRDLGCRVPEDVAVCGFDDTPLAREMNPALSSVAQPLTTLASSAFELLGRIQAGDPIPPGERSFLLKPQLMVRESSWVAEPAKAH